ncbi:MAG: biopolymer transporter ExbD [Candidatus Hydrogenedentes bacterium]|nr:biopolymer transporter ExbD [Candidatus Hydrogenedentota bacterium]
MKTGKQKVIGEINITPLTDVFLVLLIIMIVVNPLLQTTGVSTSVSSGDDAPSESQEEPKTITVNIDAAGAYSIGSDVLDNDLIRQRILAEAASHPDGIVLNVDPLAPLERMTDIMDFARSAKIQNISLSNAADAAAAEAKP